MKYCTMSLSKFLSRYACTEGADLKKITHDEVKVLFPELKRTSFDNASSNKELIAKGKIILVDDGKRVIPYCTPSVKKECEDYTCVIREEAKKEEVCSSVTDYTSLSVYELRRLLRKRFNTLEVARGARKELSRRGIKHERYNRNMTKKKKMEE